MPIYEFVRPDEVIVEKFFRFADMPNEIVCDDGVVAKRKISLNAGIIFKGTGWPTQTFKRKEQETKKNIDAGNRGRKDWKARSPKFVMK